MHYWRNSGQPGKTRFVTIAGGYHGETLGALSVSDVALFRDAYAPLLRESTTVPSPDWRNAEAGESASDFARRAAEQLSQHLAEHAATTAAVIVEPMVQCANRMAMYDAEYLRLARAACDQYGVHLIADEIAVGFGRTGTFFAHEAAHVTPDLMTLSKGITGGYLPLSVVMCHDHIYQAFYSDEFSRGFLHSHSYTGNALACAAALAVLDLFDQRDVLAANTQRARTIRDAAQPLADHPRVSHLRQTGMITAFDVDTDDPGFSRRYHLAALEHGVLLRPIGNTVYFMPPYVLTDADCDQPPRGMHRQAKCEQPGCDNCAEIRQMRHHRPLAQFQRQCFEQQGKYNCQGDIDQYTGTEKPGVGKGARYQSDNDLDHQLLQRIARRNKWRRNENRVHEASSCIAFLRALTRSSAA